jgi:hypothetical protein
MTDEEINPIPTHAPSIPPAGHNRIPRRTTKLEGENIMQLARN